MVINKEQFNSLPTNLQVCFRKKQDNLNGGAYSGGERSDGDWKDNSGFKNDKLDEYQQPLGRFPANLIHDNSEEVRECFPEAKGMATQNSSTDLNVYTGNSLYHSTTKFPPVRQGFNDSGNASRFFKSIIYQAKASKSERNKGCEELEEKAGIRTNAPRENEDVKTPTRANNHPTVKPIALMEYLIKMVTPKGGTVLDPFAGSGSTLVAAKQNDFQYIGIELEPEYIKIAEARLNNFNGSLF